MPSSFCGRRGALPGEARGAFEVYLLGGFGIQGSRPVSVVDPADRYFNTNRTIDTTFGAGARFFVGERVAFTLELRDLVYFEKIENRQVPTGSSSDPSAFDSPRNPDLFYDPATHLTNAIQLRLGASFFVLGG